MNVFQRVRENCNYFSTRLDTHLHYPSYMRHCKVTRDDFAVNVNSRECALYKLAFSSLFLMLNREMTEKCDEGEGKTYKLWGDCNKEVLRKKCEFADYVISHNQTKFLNFSWFFRPNSEFIISIMYKKMSL